MTTPRESLESKITLRLVAHRKKTNLPEAMNSLALPRISQVSIACERPERFSDVVADDQIGNVILFGRLIVDDHQSCAAVLRHQRKPCRGQGTQRRADRKEQVAMPGKLGGATHGILRHRLPERNRGGLYRLIAPGAVGRARRVEALLDPCKIISLSAADAASIGGVSMKLDDMIGRETRDLMQIIDVLGDDGGNLSGPIQRSQRAVTASRPRRGENRFHRKASPPGFIASVRAGNEFIERDRAVAAPQPARRAKIRNAAFGRNAGTGKGNNDGSFGDHVAELFHAVAKIRCYHGNNPKV